MLRKDISLMALMEAVPGVCSFKRMRKPKIIILTDLRILRSIYAVKQGLRPGQSHSIFLARVPRYDDDTLREQIRLAKVQVDEKTRFRDEIQAHIKQKRADIQIHGVDYEYAKREVSDARKLVRLKRNEIESLDHVCNKARNARSVEDIDIQVRALENKIQHETLPLKEEKRLILEIKKLNQLREELSSGLGSRNEVREALEHIGEVEEQLKTLRKELDTLKDNVLKAEESAFEAGEKYENGSREVRELQSRFRDADGVRQAAYLHWQSLKRDLSNKNKLFYKYKDDLRDANNHAFSGNTEGVHELCSNQVKVFMEMWNKSREFREEYGRLNSRSSIRRFGTLDCRSLGPDEKKPILTSSIADEEVEDSTPPTPVDPPVNHDLTSEKSVSDSHQETDFVKEQPTAQEAGQQHQNVAASAVSPDEVHDEEVAEILTEEEAEALRVAEEKRKEEAEAALREQRRQEEAAKANEARERKKKKLEQQQTRAELRLQKEAEEKEKKQEKKRRKNERRKERKKAAAACNNNDSSINNESIPETPPISEPVVESTKEKEVKDSPPATAPKKRTFSKHKKTKPLPPPLRNRNKKNWRQWMWVPVLTLLFILLLFLIGNTAGFSFSFSSLNSNW